MWVFLGKEAGAGAVDEEDFIKAFEDVPSAQVSCFELILLYFSHESKDLNLPYEQFYFAVF